MRMDIIILIIPSLTVTYSISYFLSFPFHKKKEFKC